MTKLSYLVSTYNSGHFLDNHLADLIDREIDPDFEVIVMNPASTGTDGIIGEKWSGLDKRVQYHYWPVRESYGTTWLRCWQLAKGEFVVNSNTDDFHAPNSTGSFYKHMKFAASLKSETCKIGFGYGGIQVQDIHGHVLGGGMKPQFDFDTYSHTCYGGPQLCWRNDEDFKKELNWDLMFERAAEYKSAYDYWLILYFMSLGFHGYVVPEILTIYTQRADSIENSNKWSNNWETYASISEFFPHNFKTHLKHAKEFEDFSRLPPQEEWIECMKAGKKWK